MAKTTGKRRAEDITKTPERQSGVDADQAAESVRLAANRFALLADMEEDDADEEEFCLAEWSKDPANVKGTGAMAVGRALTGMMDADALTEQETGLLGEWYKHNLAALDTTESHTAIAALQQHLDAIRSREDAMRSTPTVSPSRTAAAAKPASSHVRQLAHPSAATPLGQRAPTGPSTSRTSFERSLVANLKKLHQSTHRQVLPAVSTHGLQSPAASVPTSLGRKSPTGSPPDPGKDPAHRRAPLCLTPLMRRPMGS